MKKKDLVEVLEIYKEQSTEDSEGEENSEEKIINLLIRKLKQGKKWKAQDLKETYDSLVKNNEPEKIKEPEKAFNRSNSGASPTFKMKKFANMDLKELEGKLLKMTKEDFLILIEFLKKKLEDAINAKGQNSVSRELIQAIKSVLGEREDLTEEDCRILFTKVLVNYDKALGQFMELKIENKEQATDIAELKEKDEKYQNQVKDVLKQVIL